MTHAVAKHIATPDLEIFYGYTDKVKAEITEKLGIVERILSSDLSLEKSTAAEAVRFVGKKGFSQHNIKTLVRKFRKLGWHGLVNGSKLKGGDRSTLPIEFQEYWKDLCLDHQRGKIAPCRNELIRR